MFSRRSGHRFRQIGCFKLLTIIHRCVFTLSSRVSTKRVRFAIFFRLQGRARCRTKRHIHTHTITLILTFRVCPTFRATAHLPKCTRLDRSNRWHMYRLRDRACGCATHICIYWSGGCMPHIASPSGKEHGESSSFAHRGDVRLGLPAAVFRTKRLPHRHHLRQAVQKILQLAFIIAHLPQLPRVRAAAVRAARGRVGGRWQCVAAGGHLLTRKRDRFLKAAVLTVGLELSEHLLLRNGVPVDLMQIDLLRYCSVHSAVRCCVKPRACTARSPPWGQCTHTSRPNTLCHSSLRPRCICRSVCPTCPDTSGHSSAHTGRRPPDSPGRFDLGTMERCTETAASLPSAPVAAVP